MADPKTFADSSFADDLAALVPLLRRAARRLCRNEDAAADLVQDTLVKAWQARASFAEGTNLAGWALTIMRNHHRSEARRAWRQAEWNQEAAEAIAAPGPQQFHALELSDTAAAIGLLPDTQREALILVGIGGFSNEDAASAYGCRPAAMKNRVWRARQSLLEILDSNEPMRSTGTAAGQDATDALMSELDRLTARIAPFRRNGSAPSVSTAVAAML